ncbi:glutathione S-transferase family protein [Wenzhouxiangella sediminis]|uniref:Glutathione S-transferase family protein n=1 Tax=Wenzhouxiangella sediminis TaxID=1792836 RepID=A0A3E1K5Q4_9GAMM|nr:glutathione S-transferase family protein [Wenzhouxiangella sediminis]
MQLYGTYTSPYVRHCRIALAETGQDYELIETDYAQSARLAPAKRVPFLKAGDLVLNDSLSILKFIRESARRAFLPDVEDCDLFALTNTALDTAINLFLLEKDGLGPAQSGYLARQAARVHDILEALEGRAGALPAKTDRFTDGELRLGCFLDWALFRERITLTEHIELAAFLERMKEYPCFANTPPRVT